MNNPRIVGNGLVQSKRMGKNIRPKWVKLPKLSQAEKEFENAKCFSRKKIVIVISYINMLTDCAGYK